MTRRAFTLVEIIVVIAIVGILAGLLLPALLRSRAEARKMECMSQLKQIGHFLEMYRQEHKVGGTEQNPHRLTHLVHEYKANPKLFVCPSDRSDGEQGGKPDVAGVEQFAELDEHGPPDQLSRLPPYQGGVPPYEYPLSYMYEFSGAICDPDNDPPWYVGYISLPGGAAMTVPSTWGQVKYAQMRFGDSSFNTGAESTWHGYPESRFPVLRCFWHADDPNTTKKQIMNLAYSGRPFRSQAKWELDAFR